MTDNYLLLKISNICTWFISISCISDGDATEQAYITRAGYWIFSIVTRYFQSIRAGTLIPNVSVLLCHFDSSVILLIACLVYWYCTNLQKLSDWYSGTFTSILRYRYFFQNCRHFYIEIQMYPLMPVAHP